MTLKELLLKKEELNSKAQQIVASIQPALKPLEEEINALDKEIISKVTGPAKEKLGATGKDTGTVNLPLEGVMVKVSVSKTVKWNQEGLAAVFVRISSSGDDPRQYMKIAYEVPENNYKSWPDQIKSVFEPHRTVVAGKPKFEYTIIEVEETAKPPWEGK